METNRALRAVGDWLRREYEGGDWDISGVDLCGLCSEVSYRDGKAVGYKAGTLFNLPRRWLDSEANETAFADTGCLTIRQAHRLGSVAEEPDTLKIPAPPKNVPPPSSSFSGLKIKPSFARDIDGKALRAANVLMSAPIPAGQENLARVVDMAVLLVILRHCYHDRRPDDALPTTRIRKLWTALHASGYTDRPWNARRYKALRDHLTAAGWLVWLCEDYNAGDEEARGFCCRWRASEEPVHLVVGGDVVARNGEVVWAEGTINTILSDSPSSRGSGPLAVGALNLRNPNHPHPPHPLAHYFPDLPAYPRPRFCGTTHQSYRKAA